MKKEIHVLPIYPSDHPVGMVVPKGGSACSKCEYLDGQDCNEKHFIKWNGGRRIPAPIDMYCCDFFEAREGEDIKDIPFAKIGL